MNRPKCSYLLPEELIEALAEETRRHGYVRQKVAAAAIAHFLRSSPDERAAMFDYLDRFVRGKAK